MNTTNIRNTWERGGGVLRLIPVFVPRRFSAPGCRLRLHPDDYFALGTARGAIKERWFSSVITCMNGPLAPADEGLSYVLPADGDPAGKFTLRDAQQELGAELVGEALMKTYGGWPWSSWAASCYSPVNGRRPATITTTAAALCSKPMAKCCCRIPAPATTPISAPRS